MLDHKRVCPSAPLSTSVLCWRLGDAVHEKGFADTNRKRVPGLVCIMIIIASHSSRTYGTMNSVVISSWFTPF